MQEHGRKEGRRVDLLFVSGFETLMSSTEIVGILEDGFGLVAVGLVRG
jgi:hypothetical protein